MIRSVTTALVGNAVLAALAGCAYQDSFGLPDLTPPGTSPGAQVYPSYGAGYGYAYGYGTGYPGIYQPGYGSVYGYASPYYAAQGPYPYGYGYAYDPIPRYILVPCADSNRDGRCDAHPPKQHHDRDQHGHDDGSDDLPARPRPEPRRATPSEAANQRGPRAGSGRPSTTSDDVVSSRPTQEP